MGGYYYCDGSAVVRKLSRSHLYKFEAAPGLRAKARAGRTSVPISHVLKVPNCYNTLLAYLRYFIIRLPRLAPTEKLRDHPIAITLAQSNNTLMLIHVRTGLFSRPWTGRR